MYACMQVCVHTINITEGNLTTLVTENTHISGGSVEVKSMKRELLLHWGKVVFVNAPVHQDSFCSLQLSAEILFFNHC